MDIYMVVENIGIEDRNVACYGTKEEAESYIEKHKDDSIFTVLTCEHWVVGKTIYD